MTGQAVRLDHAVVLTGGAIDAAAYAVRVARTSRAAAGHPPSPGLDRLAEVLEGPRPDPDRDPPGQGEYMTSSAVAEQLGVSTRHVRRLATRLDARRIGGRWVYPKRSILEHLEGTPHATHPPTR